MLKKEFKRKDVERMRNLIKGNIDESSETQIGYNKKRQEYKEGDIWEENGKHWTIKNGIKQTYTKLDKAKKEVLTPLFCPSCSKIMKKRLDPKMYAIHSMCFDCVIDMEHKLRINNEYDEYEKSIIINNAQYYADDLETYLLESINSTNDHFVSENGEVERWKGGVDKESLTEETKKSFNEYREYLKNLKSNQNNE